MAINRSLHLAMFICVNPFAHTGTACSRLLVFYSVITLSLRKPEACTWDGIALCVILDPPLPMRCIFTPFPNNVVSIKQALMSFVAVFQLLSFVCTPWLGTQFPVPLTL